MYSLCTVLHNLLKKSSILTKLLTLFVFVIGIYSCKKIDSEGNGPTLQFRTDSSYVYKDDTVFIGKTFKVGIVAKKGDVNITNFIIEVCNNGTIERYLDTGLNAASLAVNEIIIKGISPKDTWTFIARDKDGSSASISFNIFASPNSTFGPVITIPSIILGAQNNSSIGSFLDIKNDVVYSLQQAYSVQDSIEILYYYDALTGNANTLASPNATIDASVFPGTYGLANWTVKNEVRYLQTTFTDADFVKFNNDSLLIATYNDPLAKRKAKNLVAGNIYVFKTADGKLGMFEVLNVTGTDAGTVEIKVKMQPY
jgi:hypothetical protein